VIISLQRFNPDQPRDIPIMLSGQLWEPHSFSYMSTSAPFDDPPISPEPAEYFFHALRSSLVAVSPLEANVLSGSWLYALIYMQVLNYAETVDYIMESPEQTDDGRVAALTRVIHALQSGKLQVTRLQEHLTKMRRSDFVDAVVKLEQILSEAQVLRNTFKETLEDRFRIKSIDAAELSVSQSRSAVAREYNL